MAYVVTHSSGDKIGREAERQKTLQAFCRRGAPPIVGATRIRVKLCLQLEDALSTAY